MLAPWPASFSYFSALASFAHEFFDAPAEQANRDIADPRNYGFNKESDHFHPVMVRDRKNE